MLGVLPAGSRRFVAATGCTTRPSGHVAVAVFGAVSSMPTAVPDTRGILSRATGPAAGRCGPAVPARTCGADAASGARGLEPWVRCRRLTRGARRSLRARARRVACWPHGTGASPSVPGRRADRPIHLTARPAASDLSARVPRGSGLSGPAGPRRSRTSRSWPSAACDSDPLARVRRPDEVQRAASRSRRTRRRSSSDAGSIGGRCDSMGASSSGPGDELPSARAGTADGRRST